MMFNTAHIARDFGRAANAYEQEATLQLRILKQLASSIPADAFVLDAGCATGALATLIPNPIIGIDIAEAMCAIASKRMPCSVASVEALPLKSHGLDAVVCASVLQWVNDLAQALAEFHRVLKPGGRLLLSVFGPQTLHELRSNFAAIGLENRVSEFHSAESWEQWARDAGFSIVRRNVSLEHETFDSVRALMKHLKTIGATNKRKDRSLNFTTVRKLQALEQNYSRMGGTIPVSFEMVSLELLRT